MTSPKEKLKLTNPWHFLAVGFGSGLSPVIPGTMGTLASLPLFWLFAEQPLSVHIIIILFSSLLGGFLCEKTSKDMGVHDHGSIVWDEFIGMWITLLVFPIYSLTLNDWEYIVVGFILFRFFDMVKPWPINWFDRRVHGGIGIMLDDIIAGLMALLALIAVGYQLHWF